MSISVYLQTIHEKKLDQVNDMDYCLAEVWPTADPKFPLLQYIDPYGNAIFNGLQMSQLKKEIASLKEVAITDEQVDLLNKISDLAERCRQQTHTFLRFRGD
jgi:hypothetical protein